MAAAALQAARDRVAAVADALITRDKIDAFDESMGNVDYRRWRRELQHVVEACGPDFMAALTTVLSVPPPAVYAAASVLDDTAAGVPTLTMPQVRQAALLSYMRKSLQPGGEALELIKDCWHAGGMSPDAAGVDHDQALIILDRRWYGAAPTSDAGVFLTGEIHL